MRNFIIIFQGRAGTSPLVQLLNKFDSISVVHQAKKSGFEPFDRHKCGRMTLGNLKKCLDIIYKDGPKSTKQLNRIYTVTAKRRLDVIADKGVVGFKMRFRPPKLYPLHIDKYPAWNDLSARFFREHYIRAFKKMMFDTLRRHDVVVLMAVRQDVLRLALSIYHGDGSGKPGHLQFNLARGNITRNEIGKINVECGRLAEIISWCETVLEKNRLLMEELKQAGIQAHPIIYEEFTTDKRSYLENLFGILELEITDDEISQVLRQEEYIRKVHSDDISEFVENHEEVMNRFADRYVSWR